MKAAHLLLRTALRTALPAIARIDRFNHQYENLNEEDPVDWNAGAIYIEFSNTIWETEGDGISQQGDTEIRLHICRSFFGDTHEENNSPALGGVMDLPIEVFKTLQGKALQDANSRDVIANIMRISSQEDNDHDGLEIDVVSFRARLYDYSLSDVRAAARTNVQAEPVVENDQGL
ncbi:MAG: hypothetical protein AB7G44_03445 [Bacteroidia bacterium]